MNLLIRSDSQKSQKEIDAALYELVCNLYFVRNDIKMLSLLKQNCMDAVVLDMETDKDDYSLEKLRNMISTHSECDIPVICVSSRNEQYFETNEFRMRIEDLIAERIKE